MREPPPAGSVNPRVLAAVLLVGLAGGWLLARTSPRAQAKESRPQLAIQIAAADARVAPSVVTIEVETRRRVRGRFHLPAGVSTPPLQLDHTQGSGLVVGAGGYILTNRHVIRHAARIAVEIPGDEHTYYATLVGEDPETDLALIRIRPAHPLPVAPLADSNRVAVGDWVVAIGSPFGLKETVTAGIVSALHRSMDPRQQFQTFIQTDAPINPGNSGGPLVNLNGQVVGINTAIYTETDGYQGIGFALPSDLVREVYPELLRQGHVTRGSLGVYFESSLAPAVRRIYGIASGVPLTQVAAHGPAAQAGLKAGDVITSVNGRSIADGNALMRAVEFYPVGRPMRVGYTRQGQAHVVDIRVADRAQLYPVAASAVATAVPVRRSGRRTEADFGMTLANQPNGRGVRVLGVVPDSFADDIGVDADDIIVQVNRRVVHSRLELDRIMSALHPGDDVALLLRREEDDGSLTQWLVGGTVPPPLLPVPGGRERP